MEIKDGASPKEVLRKRGIEYEGAGFLPELPDYLGYFFGILLLWLLYTGYSSVVSVVTDPKSTISKVSSTVSKTMDTATRKPLSRAEEVTPTPTAIFAEDVEARLLAAKKASGQKGHNKGDTRGWRKWLSLRYINNTVSNAVVAIPSFFSDLFSAEEDENLSELQGERGSPDEDPTSDRLVSF